MPKSFTLDERCLQTIKLWLTDGSYYCDDTPPSLSLYANIPEEVRKCFSADAFRFLTHSVQTVFEVEKTTAYPKLTSWRVIQIYYAAFFAAHSVLRFFGRSFSHLESGHVTFLQDRCRSETGYVPVMQSAYYLLDYDFETSRVSFERKSESHKDLWGCFNSLISSLSVSVLELRASDLRKQDLSNRFSEISDLLTYRGRYTGGNWLSVLRNEVNYESLPGPRFPFTKSTPDFTFLMSKVKDWRSGLSDAIDVKAARSDLELFFYSAFCVIDLAVSLGRDYQGMVSKPGVRSGDFSRLLHSSIAKAA